VEDTLISLAHGFGIAFQPDNLWYAFIGCLVGTLVGVLPGIGPLAGISIVLPVTFGLNATQAIIMLAGALYLISAAAIAPICLWLSPIPVALFVVYPYLKRFTSLAHLGLGLVWSMGPLAGWLAAAQSLDRFGDVVWLWLFSVLWVAGFDIIYATMDEAFDRQAGLHSLPARLGRRPALNVAVILHAAAFSALCLMWFKQLYSDTALLWLAAIAILFVWQHVIAERKPEFAFFQLNGALGFLVFGFVFAGVR